MLYNLAKRFILRLKKGTRLSAGKQALLPGLQVRGSMTKLTGSGGTSEQYDSYSDHRS